MADSSTPPTDSPRITAPDRTPPTDSTPKSPKYLALTGVAMGAADVVPGVSGGTMAFILGIYEDLLAAIRSVDLDLFRRLAKGQFQSALGQIPWRFLLPLGAGIALSIFTLGHVVSWLLEFHQVELYAFFFGLVAASILAIGADIPWTPRLGAVLVAGTALAWWIAGLVPAEAPHSPVITFLSGTVAISAMILPGISGSFILLILGQYAYVLGAVKSLNLEVIVPFLAGCTVGLAAFSRVLFWLLRRAQALTIAGLVGFMLGSLRRIWPFKTTVETMVDRHGEVVPKIQHNVLPDPAAASTWIALGLAIFGFGLILWLDRTRKQRVDVG